MKKFSNFILLLLILFPITVANKVVASNLDKGKILFAQNCNACHKGGRNVIIPEKNLKRLTLEANGMYTKESIIYQVLNGKNGMPAFGGRLDQSEIEEVAEYVMISAENNFEK